MKPEITTYSKCLCCGDIKGYITRNHNTNKDLTNNDIYSSIVTATQPETRIITDWCEECNMHTKQEDVGWDYAKDVVATPPKKAK